MKHFIAFLRAINVGGHTVKMDALREIFETLGFSSVETFIASGNVIFDYMEADPAQIEHKIESSLRQALGYDVATFIRTEAELVEIARYQPFSPGQMEQATAFNIAFLANPPGEAAQQKLQALTSDIDQFHTHGREVYWLCRKKQSESTFSNAVLEKTLGTKSTLRGLSTVQKMAEKYG